MKIALAGRTVLITGASKGIGRATALRCARARMRVALMARQRPPLDELAQEIVGDGGRAVVIVGDVAEEPDCRRAVAHAESELGPLDVLINNAGYGLLARFEETPAAEARHIVEVNLLGSFYPTAAAVPGMRKRRRGHVIFVSSAVGKKGVAGYALYSATKFGQVGLADALRAEAARDGIHVSVVYPIGTATDFRKATIRPGGTEFPARRGGPVQSADRVARAIVGCLERPRAEVYPYPALRLLAVLNQLFPNTASRVVAALRRPEPGA